jgi:hypothetical protein
LPQRYFGAQSSSIFNLTYAIGQGLLGAAGLLFLASLPIEVFAVYGNARQIPTSQNRLLASLAQTFLCSFLYTFAAGERRES